MLDRSKCKEMWVWDNKDSKQKGIVIDAFENGFCVAIIGDTSMAHFKNNRPYEPGYLFDHYEEIKEPTKRLMTRNEVLGFIAHNPHIVVRYSANKPNDPSSFSYYEHELECYLYAPITESGIIGEWKQFEVEE